MRREQIRDLTAEEAGQTRPPAPRLEPDLLTWQEVSGAKGKDKETLSRRQSPRSRDGARGKVKREASVLEAPGHAEPAGRWDRQPVPMVGPAGSGRRLTLHAGKPLESPGTASAAVSPTASAQGLDHATHASLVSAQPSALCPASPLCRPTHRLRGRGLPSGPFVYTASTISIKVRHSVLSFQI